MSEQVYCLRAKVKVSVCSLVKYNRKNDWEWQVCQKTNAGSRRRCCKMGRTGRVSPRSTLRSVFSYVSRIIFFWNIWQ